MQIDKGLGIEKDKIVKRAIAISPDRDKYFSDIIRKIKEKFAGIKILYANNIMGAKINPEHPNVDFIIIMKGTLVSKDPRAPKKEVVLIDTPYIFSDRSIAGWTIAVERGMMDQYFAYMFDRCVRISPTRFDEYIQFMCLLSLDKDNPLYWKKPENAEKLIRDIEELSVRYISRDERAKASKDYAARVANQQNK